MPRYLDADALITLIRKHKDNVTCDNESFNAVYALAHKHIIELIEAELFFKTSVIKSYIYSDTDSVK